MKNVQLLIIDPQWDFCHSSGALYVAGEDPNDPNTGGEADTVRLASMIKRLQKKWDDIHVTLDSHMPNHIAHAHLWRDANGNPPPPFTIITADDVRRGVWGPKNPAWRNKFLAYVESLETNGRYVLCIWPDHCIIGSHGYQVMPAIQEALVKWEVEETAFVNRVTKGSNPWTEHYSAVQADVPDPQDPDTQLNVGLIRTLEEADLIAITGQALSHCVLSTVQDIADNFSDESFISKFVLIEDTCSPVTKPPFPGAPDFPQIAKDWVKGMVAKGMQVSNSVDFLA